MSRPIVNRRNVTLDNRFPFPYPATPTRCRVRPQDFEFENGDRSAGGNQMEQRLANAFAACNECTLAAPCLLWALVNVEATREGIYAATTPRQRTMLRVRIKDRLGPDWRDVLAAKYEERRERAAAARLDPMPINQARIVELDRQLNGPMPRTRTLTAVCQAGNRNRLVANLRLPRPRRKPAETP